MHVNDCLLVLVFISDTSVFLNKFAPSFSHSSKSLSTVFPRRFAFVWYTMSPWISLLCLLSIFYFYFISYLSVMILELVKYRREEFIFKSQFLFRRRGKISDEIYPQNAIFFGEKCILLRHLCVIFMHFPLASLVDQMVRNPPGDLDSIPESERFPGEGTGYPFQ